MVDVYQENGITNVGFLELTGKSPEDLSGISYLENVGVILIPESLHATLMEIPQKNVGLIVTVPDLGYDWWRQLVDRSRLHTVAFSPSFFHPRQRIGSN